jgi:hypothetical protein
MHEYGVRRRARVKLTNSVGPPSQNKTVRRCSLQHLNEAMHRTRFVACAFPRSVTDRENSKLTVQEAQPTRHDRCRLRSSLYNGEEKMSHTSNESIADIVANGRVRLDEGLSRRQGVGDSLSAAALAKLQAVANNTSCLNTSCGRDREER